MRILGIETSCDETAVCIIEADGTTLSDFHFKILGNALMSQAKLHAEFGGVFPNLAKREHQKNLIPLLKSALEQSGQLREGSTGQDGIETILMRETELLPQLKNFLQSHARPDIDAVAITHGPGLEPALWVGVNFAKALAHAWSANGRMPIVAVNHMEAHIVMSAVGGTRAGALRFPMLALLISGGHTELVLSPEWMRYERIGQTRDDAVGEAFDKVARMLGLTYPGGPEISKLAERARAKNMHADFKLPRPMMREDNFDFSFAGLKTAVRKIVEANPELNGAERMKIAREFEDAVADVLVTKTLRAINEYGAGSLVVGGGVSANTFIRRRLKEALEEIGGTTLLVPPPELATDNAVMVALCGYFRALNNDFADPALLTARGNLALA